MALNWYPGHMHKASKEVVKTLLKTQAVIGLGRANTAGKLQPAFSLLCVRITRGFES